MYFLLDYDGNFKPQINLDDTRFNLGSFRIKTIHIKRSTPDLWDTHTLRVIVDFFDPKTTRGDVIQVSLDIIEEANMPHTDETRRKCVKMALKSLYMQMIDKFKNGGIYDGLLDPFTKYINYLYPEAKLSPKSTRGDTMNEWKTLIPATRPLSLTTFLDAETIEFLTKFKLSLKKYSDDFGKLYSPSLVKGCFISGSYLPCAINNVEFQDIDIYFYDAESIEYAKNFFKVRDDVILEKKEGSKSNGGVSLYTVKTKTVPANLIVYKHGTPAEIVKGFDLRMLGWYYEPSSNKFTVYPDAWADMVLKELFPMSPDRTPEEYRIEKYRKRGFHVRTEEERYV